MADVVPMAAPARRPGRRAWAAVLAAALIALALVPACAFAEDACAFADAPELAAPQVIVEDGAGNVLFSRAADESNPMASTTKVMTAVVALESGMPLSSTYVVSELAASNQGSVIGFPAGQQVTLRELLDGMLLHSGGDAADGIAECVGGSLDAFVAKMNARAEELGLTGTHYTSPDGLSDENHYSTPRDLVTLARHAMTLPAFKTTVGTTSVTLDVGGVAETFANTNPLLGVYPGMQGIKTGYTYGAGRTFVGLAQRGGQQVWFALMGEESDEARLADMQTLLDWAFAHYPEVEVCAGPDAPVGYVRAGYRFGHVIATCAQAPASLRTSPLAQTSMASLGELSCGEAQAMPGQTTGVLAWTLDGSLACARDVVATGPVLRARTFSPFVAPLFLELDAAAVE